VLIFVGIYVKRRNAYDLHHAILGTVGYNAVDLFRLIRVLPSISALKDVKSCGEIDRPAVLRAHNRRHHRIDQERRWPASPGLLLEMLS
jgi:hypothetical protein